MLIIFSGLPGSGKTTIAKALLQKISAVYLRVDTIEQAILTSPKNLANPEQTMGAEGYFVMYALAAENLALGNTVVTDSVNDLQLIRDALINIAMASQVPFLEIEIVCSDSTQHQARVDNRVADIADHICPKWQDVQNREYQAWARAHLQLDTAKLSVDACVEQVLAWLSA